MSYSSANTNEHAAQSNSISLNKSFIKTPAGILKITELVINIIIWICVGSTLYFIRSANGGFINFSATITFIFTLLLFILYFFKFIYRLPGPWILIECVSIIISIFFHSIAMLIAAFSYSYGGGVIPSAVFCALNASAYAIEMFLRFRITRSNGWKFNVTAVEGDVAIRSTVTTEDESSRISRPNDQAEFVP